jgi:triosephosphate isomerase
MKLPLILINFKTYLESLGENAIKLAKICESISKEQEVNISIAPEFFDLSKVISEVKIPVFAQHIDPIERGEKYTGHVVAENLKKIGATGTLINHSEKRLELKEIEKCVEVAKKSGLIPICCSESPAKSREIAKFGPDFIAIEPPELIGSGIAVSEAKPEVVSRGVEVIHEINKNIKVLCGAGISKGEDVKKALELGTVGVLVASAVVKARNPGDILEEMAKVKKLL